MTNIHTKVIQMLGDFWRYLKTSFSTKALGCCYFLGNFEKKLGYFLFHHQVTLVLNNVVIDFLQW